MTMLPYRCSCFVQLPESLLLNARAPPRTSTLSLHDALPILAKVVPLPFIVPPVQVVNPPTVTVSEPCRNPAHRVKTLLMTTHTSLSSGVLSLITKPLPMWLRVPVGVICVVPLLICV